MSDDQCILVLDEGTTSTRVILYSAAGDVLAIAQEELTQHYPAPGLVEHDASEIWERTLRCARAMVERAGSPSHIAGIGVTNQRETIVAWDSKTGEPVTRAIVWQDRRTEEQCRALRDAGHEAAIQHTTGLLLDPYFSASKMAWILRNVPEAAALGDRLAFGTVESWLVWKLTGGLHISDVSNASRTSLFPLVGSTWDEGLCDLFGVPRSALPEVVPSADAFGRTLPEMFGAPIAITGLAGDQQAATIGQGCFARGEAKATLGTGAFILSNMGTTPPHSTHRLLGTVLCELGGARTYALEGSVFAAGSVIKWLRDSLGMLSSSAESEALARSVADSAGVVFVPALSGLGAPYWQPEARASITGLTFAATRAHVTRAALESIAHVFHDLARAYAADGAGWEVLRLDGGMSANDWLAQDIANVLALRCERPTDVETTARGAAIFAAIGAGLFPDLATARTFIPRTDVFEPRMPEVERGERLGAWREALGE
ncbi:glycerol kinase [Novosphingobium taihuense]|uniref:ATP:glycerol 3-phosphotransferase n=1 Tax=Novosphingobium taihuense TaxID=260085 RepID=A0A7W7EWC0_9SPHN|nr:glycerol kinase [Novosphingobium taihuense]MBB4614120.1 glycerol kinase [Novosphingobium taihuense]TWH86970.1 glycerol kinase [Novosphingobium taihuense]